MAELVVGKAMECSCFLLERAILSYGNQSEVCLIKVQNICRANKEDCQLVM